MLEIDLKKISELSLTLDEGVFLNVLTHYKKEEFLPLMSQFIDMLEIENSLQEKGFIKKTHDDYILLSKTINNFIQPENFNFDDIFNLYPTSCPNGRILRTLSVDTRNYKVCKKKYLSKVKNADKHNKIVATLTAYFENAPKDQMNYLNNLETFINQEGWEKMETFVAQNNIKDMRNDI